MLHGARHRRAWGRIFGIAVLDLCNTLLMLCSLLFLPASVRDHPLPLGVSYPVPCAYPAGAVQVMLTLFFSLSLIFTALWSAAYLGQKLTRTRSAALCVGRVLYVACRAVHVACEVACRRLPGCMLHAPCCMGSFAC